MAYKEQVSKDRAKIYYEDLKGYSAAEISTAFDECRRNLDFFPRVSQILRVLNPPPEEPDLAYWPSFKNDRPQIEYQNLDREEAKRVLSGIRNDLEEKERKQAEESRIHREERLKVLRAQAEKLKTEGVN
jgi:hypothetical protein